MRCSTPSQTASHRHQAFVGNPVIDGVAFLAARHRASGVEAPGGAGDILLAGVEDLGQATDALLSFAKLIEDPDRIGSESNRG